MDNLFTFQHLSESDNLAFSIGCQTSSLAFFCYFEPKDLLNACNDFPKFKKGRIYALKFATCELNALLPILSKFINQSFSRETQVILTGEAARKNVNNIQEALKKSIILRDFSSSVVNGFYTFLKNIRDERMRIEFLDHPKYVFLNPWTGFDQYLMVSWNGNVNYFAVKSESDFERIGHSFFDSDYLMGIVRGLTHMDIENFDELVKLAKLSKSYIKLINSGYEFPAEAELTKENLNIILDSLDDLGASGDRPEIAWNLLWVWLNNIGHLAAMYAQRHNIDKVVFVEGSSNDSLCNDILDISMRFWSRNSTKPLFLRHEGYLSSIGALLMNPSSFQQKGPRSNPLIFGQAIPYLRNYTHSLSFTYSHGHNLRMEVPKAGYELYALTRDVEYCVRLFQSYEFKDSWVENFFLSSGLYENEISYCGTKYSLMVLDSIGTKLTYCPLLADPETYTPDLQNLYVDEEWRTYWFRYLEISSAKTVEHFQKDTSDNIVKAMISCHSKQFGLKLKMLNELPFAFGNLSIRSIYATADQGLKELGLIGLYQKVKSSEVLLALSIFKDRLNMLDQLPATERYKEQIKSILVGNLFDWGTMESKDLISSSQFGYTDAAQALPGRPWLYDDLDKWVERMEGGPPHKKAVIFVDNFGFDLVIGMLPFVRELLKRGTNVIIISNREPSINDVTHTELTTVMKQIASTCIIFREAMSLGHLTLMEMYRSVSFLDLGFIDVQIAEACKDADLLVIDGMGRGIMTNLKASFNVDSLILAVVKDKRVSSSLGGLYLAPICKYVPVES